MQPDYIALLTKVQHSTNANKFYYAYMGNGKGTHKAPQNEIVILEATYNGTAITSKFCVKIVGVDGDIDAILAGREGFVYTTNNVNQAKGILPEVFF